MDAMTVRHNAAAVASMVYSFDIFDTVLTRSYAAADDVHLHMGELLADRGLVRDAAQFVGARREAERMAWCAGGYSHAITIDGIYQLLQAWFGWSDTQSSQAIDLEVALEAACVREVPGMRERLRGLRHRGAHVCFVSDMHLREHHLQAMLDRLGLRAAADHLFVSSECGTTKRSRGRLFKHLLHELGVSRFQLRHCGDDLRADCLMPLLNGVPAKHTPFARLNRFEQSTLQNLSDHDWRLRSVVSASKFARLSSPAAAVPNQTWQLLCSTIAPFVAGYALWLINQAQRRGIETLFFMARDMQIVRDVAALLASEMGANVRCEYLHASRAAWQPPGYTGDLEYDLFWLTDQLKSCDPITALRRLLSAASIEHLARDGALQVHAAEPVQHTLRRWLSHEKVREIVASDVSLARGRMLRYVAECGFVPDGRCALVDAGWRGTLQKGLSRALAAQPGSPRHRILGFYIGLRHRVTMEPGCEMQPFLPDSAVARSGYALVSLIEGFLTADHGTTLGYECAADGASVHPQLGPPPRPELLSQWQAMRESCLAHARSLIELPAFAVPAAALAPALTAPLLALCTQPTPADAAALRHWRVDVGRGEPRLKSIVRQLSLADIAKLVLARVRATAEGDVYLSGPWVRGSIAGSALPVRAIATWLLRRPSAGPLSDAPGMNPPDNDEQAHLSP